MGIALAEAPETCHALWPQVAEPVPHHNQDSSILACGQERWRDENKTESGLWDVLQMSLVRLSHVAS